RAPRSARASPRWPRWASQGDLDAGEAALYLVDVVAAREVQDAAGERDHLHRFQLPHGVDDLELPTGRGLDPGAGGEDRRGEGEAVHAHQGVLARGGEGLRIGLLHDP